MADNEIEDDDAVKYDQAFLRNHKDPSGVERPDVWRQAVADFNELDLDASVLWSQIGPAPLIVAANLAQYNGIGPNSGLITDILIDPSGSTDQVLYITTGSGGIWKTTDGGASWVPLIDQMFSISIGAIAMDPTNPNILYAGSGFPYESHEDFIRGAGIYRSGDAGITWSIVDGGYFGTIFANVGINRIVCPTSSCLLVATNKGLYRSVDEGRNFGANAPAFNDRKPVVAGNVCCLFLDSATPATVVYAGVAGDSVDDSGGALPIVGLLKSTDGGTSFPTNLFNNDGAPKAPYGVFAVTQSQFDGAIANSNVFYASVQKNNAEGIGEYVNFYRSVDSGTSWVARNSLKDVAASDGFAQSYYDLTLGVDPHDSKRVYAGFQELWLSTDGGTTFQAVAVTANKAHWDHHVLVFSPASHATVPPAPPTTLYVGTDGGIAKSTDSGVNWTAINGATINSCIATNLFYGIDIGKGASNNGYTYGGCQDNGTCGYRPGDLPGQWHAGIGGDGGQVAVDPADPKIVYGFEGGAFIKSKDKGATWDEWSKGTETPIGYGLHNPHDTERPTTRTIALEQTGTNPAARTVYVGEDKKLYKSTDSGLNFKRTSIKPADFITCIVTSSTDASQVWVGTFDGSVHRSLDQATGDTWDAAPLVTTPGGSAIGPVSHIAIDPNHPQRVAVVYSGVSGIHSKFQTRHVFLTLDGGATWNDVSGIDGNGPVGNLPDLPLHSVVFDTGTTPSAIIVAGDAGVLRSTDATVTGTGVLAEGTATWKIYGAGLPTVCCNSLAIDNTVLRVGTYGRSCFEASRPTGPNFAADSYLAFGAVATGQSVTLPFHVYNCGNAVLDISAFGFLGIVPFALGAVPALPVSIPPGATQDFQVTFSPTTLGDIAGQLNITCNDTAQPSLLIPVSGMGVNTGLLPRLATNPFSTIGFGTVSTGSSRTIPVQLFNVGTAPLNISAITQTGSNDFSLSPAPAYPIAIPAGGQLDIVFQFAPSGGDAIPTTFTVLSDDPRSPLTLTASGIGYQASAIFWSSFMEQLGLATPVTR